MADSPYGGRIFRPTYTDDGEKKQSSVWWVDYSVNGKRFRESTGTRDEEEAKAYLAKKIAERGHAPAAQRAANTTFEDLCELIRNDYERNGRKTLQRLNNSIDHLEGFFDGYAASAIDEAAVERYIAKRLRDDKPSGGNYSRATINRELSALKRMLRLAFKQRLVQRMPDISLLKEDNVRKGFFSEEQLQGVLKHLPPELRPVVEVGYITGWRKGELLSRGWRHVDFGGGWLRLEPGETKNDDGRQFPMTDRLRSVLERHRQVRVAKQAKLGKIIQPLFFRYDGPHEGTRIKSFDKAWNTACKKAGHPEKLFHGFRRTAVRNLVRAGVPEKVAMELTGHKTRSVFDRYTIVAEDMLREAGDKLEESFGNT